MAADFPIYDINILHKWRVALVHIACPVSVNQCQRTSITNKIKSSTCIAPMLVSFSASDRNFLVRITIQPSNSYPLL